MTIRMLSAVLAAVVALGVCLAAPTVATHHATVSVADPERCC
jgi:hypothetical protein